jgi:actin-like protein 6A
MFEKCKIPCMFICKNAVLSSFASGKSTCLVLDVGHNTTYAAPVFEGYILHNPTLKYKIGGKFLGQKLHEYLQAKGIEVKPRYAFSRVMKEGGEEFIITPRETDGFTDSYKNYHVDKILDLFKHECSLISDASISEKKLENIKPYEYELPDGTKVEIGGERCLIPEALFAGAEVINQELTKQGGDALMGEVPDLKGFMGVQHAVTESINQTDLDIRKELYSNILVTGGCSMINGFANRLQKEIPDIAPQNLRVKVTGSHSGSVTEY